MQESIWNYDIEQMGAILAGVKKLGVVEYLEVTDELEQKLSEKGVEPKYDVSNIKKDAEVAVPGEAFRVESSNEANNGVYHGYLLKLTYTDASGERKFIGYLRMLAAPGELVNRVKYEFLLVILYAVLKTLALWALFLFFSKRIVTVPLNAMSEATSNMYKEATQGVETDSDFERVLYSTCRDELGDLAKNFIKMRKLVLEKIHYIENQNETLEHRIAERTRNLEQANEELKRLSLHDPLTGLPNRNLYHDRLSNMIESAKREDFNFVVGSIDLKKFKGINDRYGHQAGDAVLVEFAKRMSSVIRKSDTLARMGGDEFAVIAKNIGPDKGDLIAFGEKMVACAYAPIHFENQSIIAGIDIGLCSSEHELRSGDLMLKNADIAMYDAKNNEKGVSVYTRKIDEKAERYAKISSDLDDAIETNKLSVHFQPIVDCSLDKVSGIEALSRWVHPELGFVSPMEFIAIAERSSTIRALTDWVLEESIKFIKQLLPLGFEHPISVNMSGRLLDDSTFSKSIATLCKKHNVPTKYLKLELTESIMMDNPDKIIENLHVLRALGVHLSIDDFGTGYSSFSYLTRFPVDELKIDKSFLSEIESADSRVIVEAITNLAHQLGLRVVAEGVENSDVLSFIGSCGCDFAQGYHFAKPMPAEEFINWYTHRR